MIKYNDDVINVEHYPDGTQKINLKSSVEGENYIEWFYERDEEFLTVAYITGHCRDILKDCSINLYLYYIANARMDRIHNRYEIFTLKHFCKLINSLNFNQVYVLDPHSNVSVALLDRCVQLNIRNWVDDVIESIKENDKDIDLILYFPDAGACKKYSNIFTEYKYCWGEKKRDWDTGEILGLEVKTNNGEPINGKTVLMIDDIVSYGGSLYFSSLELMKLGVYQIYAYATHTENSILDKEKGTLIKSLENNTVKKLFTTNSLYTGTHEKIQVMKLG